MWTPRLLALLAFGLLLAPAYAAPTPDAGGLIPEDRIRFVSAFLADYNSWDPTKLSRWIHPRRGVIDSRTLKTKEQFQGAMASSVSVLKAQKVKYGFGYGQFEGDGSFYKVLYRQTEGSFPLEAGGSKTVNVKIDMMMVFEEIAEQWYLVQIHPYSNVSANWRTLGDNVLDERLEGRTLSDRRFTLSYAMGKHRPVLLAFFDQGQDILLDVNINHLRSVHRWYGELKNQPIYLLNVNEYPKQANIDYLSVNEIEMPVLLDDQSTWHRQFDVDMHPYLILIDGEGFLRAINRGNYDAQSYTLFRTIVSDVVHASAGSGTAQNSPAGGVNPSAKF